MKIRKQVYHLRLEDLRLHPIWEYALDEEGVEGQDEATVRPCLDGKAADPSQGMYIVQTIFCYADGTIATGFITPPIVENNNLGTIQPVVVTEEGQVAFWNGIFEPKAEELTASYKLLSTDPERLFPIKYESKGAVVGGPVRGTVDGFMILEDWRTGKFRVVR